MLNSKRFYVILVGAILILSFISFVVTFFSVNLMTKKNIEECERVIIAQKKQELEDRISIVYKIVETNYQETLFENRIKKAKEISKKRLYTLFSILNAYYKTHKTDKNLKSDLKLIVKNATYDKNKFYFWINDFYPNMVMNPILPELDNTSLKDFQDKTGKYVFQEIVNLIKTKKEGLISYFWLDPKHNTIEKKISYVKLFEPLKWIIGTGVYIQNNTQIIQKKTLEEIKNATFGINGYFWVNDMNYKMIMHPIKPEYDGKIFIDTPKVPFVELGVDALKKSKKDFAFIEYKFYNPATKKYERKLSIVKLFKPWNWVIGTGVYLVDIDKTIENIRAVSEKELEKIIIIFVIINIIAIVTILLIAKNFLDKYEVLATKDRLTNIYNRLKIDEELKEHFEIAKRYKREFSIIFFDIDHFKRVNDTYGHKIGDEVLKEIANLVSKNIRTSDIFGRWGGEEFIIILPETNLDEAYKVAEKLRKIISNYHFKKVGHITCSFGVVSYNGEKSINELIEKVDKLLYKSKKNGRNRVSK